MTGSAGATGRLLLLHCLIGLGMSRGDLEADLRAKYVEKSAKIQSLGLELPWAKERVHYLAAGPESSDKLVILLHGMAFSSETWRVTNTIDALGEAGLRVVALDLPGYKNVPRGSEVLESVLRALKPGGWTGRVLVVAASMGGTVGSPFVLAHPERVAGYVSASALIDDSASTSDVPALLIWGERDSPDSSKASPPATGPPPHPARVRAPRAAARAGATRPRALSRRRVRTSASSARTPRWSCPTRRTRRTSRSPSSSTTCSSPSRCTAGARPRRTARRSSGRRRAGKGRTTSSDRLLRCGCGEPASAGLGVTSYSRV